MNGQAQDVPKPQVREEQFVTINSEKERWQLVWEGKPATVCGPDEVDMAITCPCNGFAYAEYGKLFLVRKRAGHSVERMDLRPLFGRYDYPEAKKVEGTAYVQRWPFKISDGDRDLHDDPNLESEIRHRPAPTIMQFADYDHDGGATEFLLQVGTLPCGKSQFAAIGVSRKDNQLHALSTAERPDDPLIMPIQAWMALRKATKPRSVLIWNCNDHGSDVRSELLVSAERGDIHVTERDFNCETNNLASERPF
jgi:hypothetical protein